MTAPSPTPENPAAASASSPSGLLGLPGWLADLAIALVLALAAMGVFGNSLHKDFVYDDDRQIVQNVFLQDPGLFVRAMLSDVWAFKADRPGANSNYWRPTFVLWMMANYRAFGVESAVGWHVTSILLHGCATALAFLVVRRLGAGRAVAGAIGLLFAVHPAHVESVAWVSGSPDLLLACALLCLILCVSPPGGGRLGLARWAFALALYGVALLAKEVAILFPAVLLVLWALAPDAPRGAIGRVRFAAWRALPFLAMGAIYFVARLIVLKGVQITATGSPPLHEAPLSVPRLVVFYLRQVFWPVEIGPQHPVRPVAADAVNATTFWIPLAVSAAVAFALCFAAGRNRLRWVGLVLAGVIIAPAMNVSALLPEQAVHDRYLYLPLLGLLMVVVPTVAGLLARLLNGRTRTAEIATLVLAFLASGPLAAQTWRHSAYWGSNIALWARAVETDPNSSFAWSQLGVFLNEEGRRSEAIAAFDRALQIAPFLNAYMGRADVLIAQGRFPEAERDLAEALRLGPTLWPVHERVMVAYDRQGKRAEAAEALRRAREAIPALHGMITERLAVILYSDGCKEQALAELEAARDAAHREPGSESKVVFFRLGQLYREMDRHKEAASAFSTFLEETDPFAGQRMAQLRGEARAALRTLPTPDGR